MAATPDSILSIVSLGWIGGKASKARISGRFFRSACGHMDKAFSSIARSSSLFGYRGLN
jgi:hypothetical protein